MDGNLRNRSLRCALQKSVAILTSVSLVEPCLILDFTSDYELLSLILINWFYRLWDGSYITILNSILFSKMQFLDSLSDNVPFPTDVLSLVQESTCRHVRLLRSTRPSRLTQLRIGACCIDQRSDLLRGLLLHFDVALLWGSCNELLEAR